MLFSPSVPPTQFLSRAIYEQAGCAIPFLPSTYTSGQEMCTSAETGEKKAETGEKKAETGEKKLRPIKTASRLEMSKWTVKKLVIKFFSSRFGPKLIIGLYTQNGIGSIIRQPGSGIRHELVYNCKKKSAVDLLTH